jgi:hypothetical protein
MTSIILVACLAFVLVKVVGISTLSKWVARKPFTCEVCMAGWLAVPYCWHEWYTPLYMAGAMVVTIIITGFLKKL